MSDTDAALFVYATGLFLAAFIALMIWLFDSGKNADRQAAGVALYCWAWPILLIALLWKTKTWAFSGDKS